LVSGLINLETTVRVSGFPLAYNPVNYPFWGVQSRISGVGYNISRALTVLGDTVQFLSLVGTDQAGTMAAHALAADGIPAENVLAQLPQTAHSAILYDETGRRQIHVDLKDIQERAYPLERAASALAGCDLAVLCNINFSRPLLKLAKQAGKPVATDVHTISDLEDAYNSDFMAAADILFMSDERLPMPPEEWLRAVWSKYSTPVVVIGMGSRGALLGLRSENAMERIPAARTRPVVNSIGAGDALFSCFLHHYTATGDARAALRRAVVFASWKIGAASAADGFLDSAGLETLFREVSGGSSIA
ncbi:MAG TPA: carbohydrate kinase family protein, partial [Anaerolineaceae bacterium]|nr:carbohydrate kinase family protein [Anaerolineaceae bacterium]